MNDADAQLFLAINHLLPPAVGALGVWLSFLGSALCMPLWMAAIAVASRRQRFRALWLCAASVATATALDQALKFLIRRPRPYHALLDARVYGVHERGYSFPSGHSTGAFALAVAVTLCWPRVGAVALPLAMLVALSRVVVGAHYPLDLVAGALLGAATAIALDRAWRRFAPVPPPAPPASAGGGGAGELNPPRLTVGP